ncbi:MAG: polysaccharide deacetylase family protein [Lachnospiraceae bacterium]
MKKIALTFDDGPNTIVTPLVLDLLEQYNAKATFFLIGEKIIEETVPVMKRAVSLGCEIENHSFSHPAMTELTTEERLFQVKKTTELIEEHINTKVRYFRPPYIAVNEEMARDVKYPLICGIGCNDWDENVSVESRIRQVISNAEEGQIILLHDSDYNVNTWEALKTIIPELLKREYEFVTVHELFSSLEEEPEIGTGRLYSVIK